MDYDLLSRVSNARGVSGFEDDVQSVVRETLAECCDEVRNDRLGNVIGTRRAVSVPEGASRPVRVALAAHSDEIGMMVKHIGPDGYIRFQPIGGLHAPALISQQVIIAGREDVRGVIAPNFTMPREVAALTDLVIDVARPVDEVNRLIRVGDPITLVGDVVRLNDKTVLGRNFDDRIGTFTLLETMRRLAETHADVYAVSTVQEEVGVRGAGAAAFAIRPDIGIAIDGSIPRGAFPEPNDPTTDLGGGAGIYLMDNLTISNPRLVSYLFDLAERFDITVQREVGGGTDASALQRTAGGALATTVGAPVRYMHSTVQLANIDDIDATITLLTTFLEHAHEFLTIDE